LIIGAVIGTGILHKEKAGISGQVRWLLDKWDWGAVAAGALRAGRYPHRSTNLLICSQS
jgi:hypothetical protein